METEELIRQDMSATREALSEKVETLEKMAGSVEEVAASVTSTVAEVTDSVRKGSEMVKEAANDLQNYYERYTWLVLGGSLLAGGLLATGGKRGKRARLPVPSRITAMTGNGRHDLGEPASLPQQTPDHSWLKQFAPEFERLKSLGLGVLFGTVREAIVGQAPPQVAQVLRGIIDDFAKKLGGEPIPSSDLRG